MDTINSDEFLDNPDYCLLSNSESGIKHISKKHELIPLCGRKLKNFQVYDLFVESDLCLDCAMKWGDIE